VAEFILPEMQPGDPRPTAEEMGALPARPAPPAAPEQPPTPAVPANQAPRAKSLGVRKCTHCGKELTAKHYSNAYCSEECGKIAYKIARLGYEKPVTFDGSPSVGSDMAKQIIQEGDVW